VKKREKGGNLPFPRTAGRPKSIRAPRSGNPRAKGLSKKGKKRKNNIDMNDTVPKEAPKCMPQLFTNEEKKENRRAHKCITIGREWRERGRKENWSSYKARGKKRDNWSKKSCCPQCKYEGPTIQGGKAWGPLIFVGGKRISRKQDHSFRGSLSEQKRSGNSFKFEMEGRSSSRCRSA